MSDYFCSNPTRFSAEDSIFCAGPQKEDSICCTDPERFVISVQEPNVEPPGRVDPGKALHLPDNAKSKAEEDRIHQLASPKDDGFKTAKAQGKVVASLGSPAALSRIPFPQGSTNASLQNTNNTNEAYSVLQNCHDEGLDMKVRESISDQKKYWQSIINQSGRLTGGDVPGDTRTESRGETRTESSHGGRKFETFVERDSPLGRTYHHFLSKNSYGQVEHSSFKKVMTIRHSASLGSA